MINIYAVLLGYYYFERDLLCLWCFSFTNKTTNSRFMATHNSVRNINSDFRLQQPTRRRQILTDVERTTMSGRLVAQGGAMAAGASAAGAIPGSMSDEEDGGEENEGVGGGADAASALLQLSSCALPDLPATLNATTSSKYVAECLPRIAGAITSLLATNVSLRQEVQLLRNEVGNARRAISSISNAAQQGGAKASKVTIVSPPPVIAPLLKNILKDLFARYVCFVITFIFLLRLMHVSVCEQDEVLDRCTVGQLHGQRLGWPTPANSGIVSECRVTREYPQEMGSRVRIVLRAPNVLRAPIITTSISCSERQSYCQNFQFRCRKKLCIL
jgi:hypothetical protein